MMSACKPRKRSKPYYGAGPTKKKRVGGSRELSCGMQGVLISTNDQEKICVSEAYNLLNEYADELYGHEITGAAADRSEAEEEGEDIAGAVAREVEALKDRAAVLRRFQACRSGAKHLVFIQCREPVEPCQLVHHMLSKVMASGVHKSRFCQRIIPVMKVCHATLEDIRKQATEVLEPHFYGDDTCAIKFGVHFKSRNNSTLKRDDVIHLLASMVTREGDYQHTVDLNNPDATVVAEVVKNVCCLSVVKDFKKLKNYNIHSIVEVKPELAEAVAAKEEPSQQDASTDPCPSTDACPSQPDDEAVAGI